MRRLIVLLALAAGACASTADVLESSIDETVFIGKPLPEVSQCLQVRLSEAPITAADGKTTFLIKNQYQATLATLTLSPAAAGTQIDIRRTQGLVLTGVWRKCR